MKFLCDSCGTKYSIADERVRGRVLKIRCKKCDFVITVREDNAAAATGAVEVPDVLRASGVQASMMAAAEEVPEEERTALGSMSADEMAALSAASAKPSAKEADDWFVSFDGEQEGPYALDKAKARVASEKPSGKEIHAWRPGFLVWLPVEEVPELAGEAKAAPVRPALPTPGSGPNKDKPATPAAAIAKDPSGPRAALSVSAGEKAKVAPPVPSNVPAGGLFDSPSSRSGAPSGIQSMFSDSAPVEDELDEEEDSGSDVPDLPISTEASGLVNLAHLAQAAMGQKPAGPIFINGQTGRQGAQLRGAPPPSLEALTALDPPEPAPGASSGPVLVMAGAAQAAPSPIFKYLALAAIPLLVGLVGAVAYLATHRATETIVVTEQSRHRDDSPIAFNDPNIPVGNQQDPKRAGGKRVGGGATNPATVGKGQPVQPGAKTPDNLSGSQKSLADLYKEDGDKSTPHAIGGRAGGDAAGGQVSQAAIFSAINSNKRQLTQCYERALKHDSTLKSGRVPIQVTVGMSGRVTAVTIPDATYASSELGQCFVASVKRWSFPASDAQYSTEFPFILQGQ